MGRQRQDKIERTFIANDKSSQVKKDRFDLSVRTIVQKFSVDSPLLSKGVEKVMKFEHVKSLFEYIGLIRLQDETNDEANTKPLYSRQQIRMNEQ